MRFDKYSFPHPVLGSGDDIAGKTGAELTVDDDDENAFVVTARYTVDNADIQDLISDGRAVYYCEITCSATLFRDVAVSSEPITVFTLPRDRVREKVEFLCLVVTTDAIAEYENSSVHPELAGISTDLDRGDILAYLGRASFLADIAFDKLKAASTFMEIVEGDQDGGPFDVILDNPKILIRLPKKDYASYKTPAIGSNESLASTFQSSVALPALVYALDQLANSDDYSDKPWARAVNWRLENEFAAAGLTLDSESVLNIAQQLLGAPIGRLLEDLKTPPSEGDGGEE